MASGSLLSKWLGRRKAEASPAAVQRQDYPLSYGQERLWSLARLYPDNPFYNYAEVYTLRGPLDEKRLRESYADVVARHDVLRVTFGADAGADKVRQRVSKEVSFDFSRRTLLDGAVIGDVLLEAARRPFDLERGPVSRLLLLHLDEEHHVLLIAMHHIVGDRGSLAILRKELADAYRHGGRVVDAPDPGLTYPRFAELQRQKDLTAELNYWAEALNGAPSLLELPTDRPRPERQSFRGHTLDRHLPAALSANIRDRCRQAGVTPFAYFLAAYWVLLRRYSGQDDLLVGTPITNRDRGDTQRTIGFFNETIVLRGQLRRAMTFADLLEHAGRVVFDALAHKNAPLEAVVKQLKPARRPGTNPLFQAMLVMQEVLPMPPLTDTLSWQARPLDLGVTKFDLSLFVADEASGFKLSFEYATDLFDEARIVDMLAGMHHILTHVSQQPAASLDALPLLTETELPRLSRSPYEAPRIVGTVTEWIGRQIADRPRAAAIRYGEDALTYDEFGRRATTLAHDLRRRGVGVGDFVGLRVGRGPHLAVGIYGILLAGAAYVPIDPAYPAERRKFMVADAGIEFVVTDDYLDSLPADQNEPPPPVAADPDGPAYLIYTSGSSGRPKGVVVSHHNLAFSTAARSTVYGGAPGVFMLLSSISFDSSVAGIFWTLTGGGTLVVSPERAEQDMRGLARTIAEAKVSHTLMLPTLYAHLMEAAEEGALRSLDTVIVAGEACPARVVTEHFARLPRVRLFNEYGPTEATVWCSVHEINRDDGREHPVPIGRPVPDYAIYVVDERLRPVPRGVDGEICVAGAGLTAGYHHRPELTLQKFVTLDLPENESERVYRTGDLGRWGYDGKLYFRGRRDRQTKIRGYRIEPAEVREVILHDERVREAAVAVDGNRLLAYAVGEVTEEELREWLGARLPAYMVPTRLHMVEAISRLPNGKLDLPALRQLASQILPPTNTEPPANDTERTLLAIWRELLGLEQISVHDNFFSLGGDSIISIRLVAEAARRGLRLPPSAIFERQTVRGLAALAEAVEEAAPPEDPTEVAGPVPLTPIQHWFFSEHHRAPHHWNQAWQLKVPDGATTKALHQLADSLWRAYDGLRTVFERNDEDWKANILPADTEGYFGVYAAADPQKVISHLQDSLSLSQGALFRVLYFMNAGQLWFFAHHLAVDAVSWQRMLTEVGHTLAGKPTEPSVGASASFRSWARQQEAWGREGRFREQLSYWRAQGATSLRTDLPAELPVPEASARTAETNFSSELTEALLRSANRAYGTRPEELLLTAVLLALAEYDGAAEHCLQLERHGREALESDLDLGQTVGWLTAAYPLRFRVGSDVAATIVATKERLRGVPDGGIGYGILRYLTPGTDLNGAVGGTVYLNYLGQRGTPSATHPRPVLSGMRHPAGERRRSWELNFEVVAGRLWLGWTYSNLLHHPETVASLSDRLRYHLTAVVNHCTQQRDRHHTPSDFREADLSQDDLDELMNQLG